SSQSLRANLSGLVQPLNPTVYRQGSHRWADTTEPFAITARSEHSSHPGQATVAMLDIQAFHAGLVSFSLRKAQDFYGT
ncbi:MAG: hypothetical protein AAFX99_36140, partial [Myxococcota bacterium]